jgi:glycosyl transferase family 2
VSVTAVIPSVPPRAGLLARAVASVAAQDRPVEAVAIAIDTQHQGPGLTRTRALTMATTKWVAMLDDDDEWKPHHVRCLVDAAEEQDADVAYAWCDVVSGTDPFTFFGQPWDNANPHIFGCWFLAKTELLKDTGGWLSREQMGPDWKPEWQEDGSGGGEDWNLILRLIAADAKIIHVPERSYLWHHDGHHYSGGTW